MGKGRAGAPQPGVNPEAVAAGPWTLRGAASEAVAVQRPPSTRLLPAASLTRSRGGSMAGGSPSCGALWQGAESVPPPGTITPLGAEPTGVNAPVCPHLPAGRLAVLIMRLSAGSDAEGLCAAPRAPAQQGWDSPGPSLLALRFFP